MKALNLYVVGLAVLAIGLLLTANVGAEDQVTVTPSQLTVSATRGSVETRTLLLRATEPITGLQVIPLDLNQADGKHILPGSAIHVKLSRPWCESNGKNTQSVSAIPIKPPQDRIGADSLFSLSVIVDLHKVSSGRFSGDLMVGYSGGSLTIPVTVTVKDRWPWPLSVMIIGVVLSVAFTAYRTQGQPHDKVLVRVGRLRAQVRSGAELMRDDARLAKRFRARIEEHMVDTEAALQAEEWNAAQQAVTRAEEVWLRWRKGRGDWLVQQDYRDELVERLEKFDAQSPYVQIVSRGLEDAIRQAPDMNGPDVLRGRLQALTDQINRYARLQAELDQLNQLRNQLPANEDEPWRVRIVGLQQELGTLKPDDEAAYQALQGKLDATLTELNQQLLRLGEPEAVAEGVRGVEEALQRLLAPAPSSLPLTPDVSVIWARLRLRLFSGASYVLAVVFLVGVGFGELYGANATFGANAWTDYFALLAWGFGAEATRAAVTEVVRTWGVPGVK
jgi:hypothetical protein